MISEHSDTVQVVIQLIIDTFIHTKLQKVIEFMDSFFHQIIPQLEPRPQQLEHPTLRVRPQQTGRVVQQQPQQTVIFDEHQRDRRVVKITRNCVHSLDERFQQAQQRILTRNPRIADHLLPRVDGRPQISKDVELGRVDLSSKVHRMVSADLRKQPAELLGQAHDSDPHFFALFEVIDQLSTQPLELVFPELPSLQPNFLRLGRLQLPENDSEHFEYRKNQLISDEKRLERVALK